VPLGKRLRVGWHVARSVLQSDWRRLDGMAARAWLIDSIGEEAYEVIWHPLLRVKFGDEYDKISAAWLWHRIVRVARSRHSWWGRSSFGYLTHGSETIVRALHDFLAAQPNVSLKLGTRVISLDIHDNAVRGVRLDQGMIGCSAVISTVALPLLNRLVPGQTSGYFDRIRQVRYLGLVCALFSLKRPFTSNFWLNINDPAISFNGIIEQTNLNRHLREAGLNVIYVPFYLATTEPRYASTDPELFNEYVPMLRRVNPEFDESWIEEFFVARTPHAQAVCHTHFAELRPGHRAPIRGLYVTDSTQFYPEDRTLSAAIEQGRRAASLCLEDGRVVRAESAHQAL
jgi:protoporphyrinogen oxidase